MGTMAPPKAPKGPKAPPQPPEGDDPPEHGHGGHVKRAMSARQVAKRLGRPHSTVLNWLTSGRLRGSFVTGSGWEVEPESLEELITELEDEGMPPDPVADKLEAMASAVVEATKATARLTELLTKPLEMLLRFNEQALGNAYTRAKELEERMGKMFDSHQEALDRSTERTIALNREAAQDKRIGEAIDWVKEEAPKILQYGGIMKHLDKAAAYFGKMTPQDAEDFAAGVEQEEGAETGEALRELFAMMRERARKSAEKKPTPPAQEAKPTEQPKEPTP